MSGKPVSFKLKKLGDALDRLAGALGVPAEQPLAVDGTIQRFEFCIELAWKMLRVLIEEGGGRVLARSSWV